MSFGTMLIKVFICISIIERSTQFYYNPTKPNTNNCPKSCQILMLFVNSITNMTMSDDF